MKEPISIKEILAIIIRHGRAVILSTLILAVLLGGFQGVKAMKAVNSDTNTPEKVAERNAEASAEYEMHKEMLDRQIANMEHKIEKQQQYNENSLLMQLNPYEKYESHVILAVTELEENAFQQIYKEQATPVDYIVTKIVQQYLIYWNNLDLHSNLRNNPYPDAPEKHIREVVTVKKTDGGTITVCASANSPEEAQTLCQSVYEAIVKAQATISEATYAHGLTQISSGTKQTVDYDLDKTQIGNYTNIDTYVVKLEEYNKQLDALKIPTEETVITVSSAVKSAIKWAVIGALVGFVLACGCAWLLYIVKDGVETSRQAEAILGVPFLGSAAGKKSLFENLADRFVGERCWKDDREAIAYIGETVKSKLSAPTSLALLSTADICEDHAGVQAVMQMLKEQGHAVIFAGRAEENPAAVAALRQCDRVLLAECLGSANRNAILCVTEQARAQRCELIGFVTVSKRG